MNILFVKGKESFADYYIDKLISSAKASGLGFYTVDYKDPTSFISDEFTDFINKSDVKAVSFDLAGLDISDEDGSIIFDKYDIPLYSVLSKPALACKDLLLQADNKTHIIISDKHDELYIEKNFPNVKDILYMPLGGCFEAEENGESKPLDFEKRDIDVLFAFSCEDDFNGEDPKIEFPGINSIAFFTDTQVMLAEAPYKTVEGVIREYCGALENKLSEEQISELIEKHSDFIKSSVDRFNKQELIHRLDTAGIKVQVFGDGWESSKYIYSENIQIHEPLSPKEANLMTGRARIAVNFLGHYKNGATARFFDNMLNGAVCISDTNEYTERRFKDGKQMVKLDILNPNQTLADIQYLLSHKDRAKEIAKSGCEAAQKESWKKRFARLVELISK